MEGRFNGGFFALPVWRGLYLGGGLYLEGLIHGGAYFLNFTVFFNMNRPQMNEWIHWFRVDGRLIRDKNIYAVFKISRLSR